MEIELAISFVLLLVLTFLASVDMAFGQLSDIGLRRLAAEAEEHPNARYAPFLKEILENRARFSFTLSAAIQILLVIFTVLITFIALRWFSTNTWALFVSLAIGLVLAGIFRQFIPRLISLRNPEAKFLYFLPWLRPFYRTLAFAAEPWHRSFDRLRQQDEIEDAHEDEEDDDTDDDIEALIDVGEAEGIIEEEERELIQSAIEFGDTSVGEVMTPRTGIVALPKTATVRDARTMIIESKHSRLPVYRDQIDNVEGIVYLRDLLPSLSMGTADAPIESFIRPYYAVPETKPVAELLAEMQKAHVYMAIVIDEYGGVAGLVTVEDILEEIVGEIQDEYDQAEELEIQPAGENEWLINARANLGDINDALHVHFPVEEADTLGGFIYMQLGKVPLPGDEVRHENVLMKVINVAGRRIGKVKVQLLAEESASEKKEED